MSLENIIVANIGWSTDYLGERVSSHMSYVAEHGTGAEAYNFAPSRDGLFYGYARNAANLPKRSDRLWSIVFVSKPKDPDHLRVVGWYEDAVVGGYRSRPEYGYEPDFPDLTSGEQFIYSAVAAKAFVVPNHLRANLTLPRGHRIGATGIYFAAGEENPKDSAEQAASREAMAEWLRSVLPSMRQRSRRDRPASIAPEVLPGIVVDEGGTPSGYSPVSESDEHRDLRLWAQANPAVFTGKSGSLGQTEWSLKSGDRVDAVHECAGEIFLIEAKSRRSLQADLERGVYQCIKYRAVVQAHDEAVGRTRAVSAILLTEIELPNNLRQIAERHGVKLVTHFFESSDQK